MYHSRHTPVDLRDFKSEDRYKFLMGNGHSATHRARHISERRWRAQRRTLQPISSSFSVEPPLLAFVAHELPTGHKDTVANVPEVEGIRDQHGERKRWRRKVQQCSVSYPPSISEVSRGRLSRLAIVERGVRNASPNLTFTLNAGYIGR